MPEEGIYNEVDHRAFSPSPQMCASEDVLTGIGPRFLDEAVHPFGVGIYRKTPGSNALEPMELFYVSEAVCDDRSLSSPPMEPGWYLAVDNSDVDQEFEVNVSVRSCGKWNSLKDAIGGDTACISIAINGVKWSNGFVRHVYSLDSFDAIFDGFFEKGERSGLLRSGNLRAFTFSKAKVVEDGGDSLEQDGSHCAGEISVWFGKADKGPRQRRSSSAIYRGVQVKNLSVSERDAVKKGRSVTVKPDGRIFKQQRRVSQFRRQHVNKAPLQSMGITIRMRERVWLQSRRIIDADGKPITKGTAVKLALANSIGGIARPSSKVKIEKQEDETIDLT